MKGKPLIRIGLIGHGKAGQAVASVLQQDPRFELAWVVRHSPVEAGATTSEGVPLIDMGTLLGSRWSDDRPVDGVVDFSTPSAIHSYAPLARTHRWMVVSAISAYQAHDLDLARDLGTTCRIMCSPNITLGINFMIMAARWLQEIAPFADIEILEQHFKEKPEVSGTAKKIAAHLDLPEEKITSLRLGGIVGHHEVIFGFPYQTLRIVHDSIRREAFGTGAAFALGELALQAPGFYTFDELLLQRIRGTLTVKATTH